MYDIDKEGLPFYKEKYIEMRQSLQEELQTDFAPRCESNIKLVHLLQRLNLYKRAEKVFHCGTYLSLAVPLDLSEKPFLIHANFCRDRLCSMCGWRRSLKVFSQVSRVMDEIHDDYHFIFVTLTLRNVPSGKLTEALDHLSEAFNLFMTYSKVRKSFKGCFKAVEITRSKTLTDLEWHPHLHIIFAVDKLHYFDGRVYITQRELCELWQRALKEDYAPIVDIRRVRKKETNKNPKDGSVNYVSAVAEVAKYTIKSNDIFRGSEESQLDSVVTLSQALRGRRLCSFCGIFKETAKKLKLQDLEDGDLTDEDKLRPDIHYMVINASWQVGIGYTFHPDKEIYTGLKRRKAK